MKKGFGRVGVITVIVWAVGLLLLSACNNKSIKELWESNLTDQNTEDENEAKDVVLEVVSTFAGNDFFIFKEQ